MQKEVTIQAPEGYEIDKEKSTFEKIVFKPKAPEKPKWEDFGEVKSYFVSSYSKIGELKDSIVTDSTKNTWPTKEEAEACIALSQLCQWRDKYNEGWKPNWNNTKEGKHCICIEKNAITFGLYSFTNKILSFKTDKIRNKFLEDFRDLIETAKPLL